MFKYLLVAVFLPAVVFGSTNVRQCSGKPFPHEVRIAGCNTMPCSAPQGRDIIMEMDFTTNTPTALLTPTVQAIAFGVSTPYPLPEDLRQGCNWLLNTRCPLDAGERPTYKFVFNVSRIYPPIPVTVELTLEDEFGRHIACFAVDLRITLGKNLI